MIKFKPSDLYITPTTAMQLRFPQHGLRHDIYIGSWKIAEVYNDEHSYWHIKNDISRFKSLENAVDGLVRRLNGETTRW